jgi:hypothetical protein
MTHRPACRDTARCRGHRRNWLGRGATARASNLPPEPTRGGRRAQPPPVRATRSCSDAPMPYAAHEPMMMLTLLMYCYAVGERSSRRIGRRCIALHRGLRGPCDGPIKRRITRLSRAFASATSGRWPTSSARCSASVRRRGWSASTCRPSTARRSTPALGIRPASMMSNRPRRSWRRLAGLAAGLQRPGRDQHQ